MINAKRLINTFTELVSIDSPSLEERDAGNYIKKRLKAMGIEPFEDNAGEKLGGNCGNIYGRLDGEGTPVLFCAHMDTVEPSRGKKACIDSDGKITSYGATVLGADDMSGVACILESLEAIIESGVGHRPVEVLFTIAEEIYCQGIKEIDCSKIEAREAYVMDLNGPIGTAAYRAPSINSFTVTVSGKPSHAGFAPEKGVHAILAASRAISRIQMGRYEDGSTVNIGTISGGTLTNIVPDKCVVCGEVRSFSKGTAQERLSSIEKHFRQETEKLGVSIDMEYNSNGPAFEVSQDSTVVKRFERICHALNIVPDLISTYGGSDNNDLSGTMGFEGLVVACGMEQCHSCDEYSTTESLESAANLTFSLMTHMD